MRSSSVSLTMSYLRSSSLMYEFVVSWFVRLFHCVHDNGIISLIATQYDDAWSTFNSVIVCLPPVVILLRADLANRSILAVSVRMSLTDSSDSIRIGDPMLAITSSQKITRRVMTKRLVIPLESCGFDRLITVLFVIRTIMLGDWFLFSRSCLHFLAIRAPLECGLTNAISQAVDPIPIVNLQAVTQPLMQLKTLRVIQG